ncbi:chymotrypsin-2-like [Fopius arisanus]|uniref:Chymotrypsin-2-like n=1 Tax=Fopius arisanus TaxID=64838 RepID=A0A9R1TJK1_9HYME|nr:PREDICTED: chymotrypsin-2-like [Fopius arisanus]
MQFKVIQLMLSLAVHISGGYAQHFENIVNGQNTRLGQFPHQVSMQQASSHFCGGSIIDAMHILTAAHCVFDENDRMLRPESIRIVTGVIDYRAANYENTFPVAMIIPHRNYHSFALMNDIAIVKLARPIPFNSLQKPIRLPTKNTFPGTVATASGWGAVWGDRPETAGPLPKYLQQLGMIAISRGECARMHGNQIFPGQLCATRTRGTGICFGDSGGPLISNGEIIGIASFVKGGCASQYPDVFTHVYLYLPWIQEVLARY